MHSRSRSPSNKAQNSPSPHTRKQGDVKKNDSDIKVTMLIDGKNENRSNSDKSKDDVTVTSLNGHRQNGHNRDDNDEQKDTNMDNE
jgi:hypothetical protein